MHMIRILNTITLVISLRKRRGWRDCSSAFGLILCSIVIFNLFCLWKNSGCPSYTRSDFCQRVFEKAFLVRDVSVDLVLPTDYHNLMDLKNFTFLINVPPCNQTTTLLLIIVHTNTINFAQRMTIRNTWGSVVDDRYRLLFLLGFTDNATVQSQLEKEHKEHGDMIQGNFVDTYRNLTYKHVMGLKWKEYFCPHVTHVLKTDDDVFINLPKVLNETTSPMATPVRGLLRCNIQIHPRAYRTWRSKWRVTWTEYEFRRYPTFCEGFTILYSSDVVTELYFLAQRARYFWVDDVFITGILAQFPGFEHTSFDKSMITHNQLAKVINGSLPVENFLVGPSNLNQKDIVNLWKRVQEKRIK